MSERNASACPESAGSEPRPLEYDEVIAHLAAGYANSQSVVRFLDTKAAAVVGVVPILLAILAAVFKWLQDSIDWQTTFETMWPCPAWVLGVAFFVLALLLLTFAWLSVKSAFNAILPRPPGKTKASVLFPYDSPDFGDRIDLFVGKPTQSDAFEDYKRQITRMSQITAIKVKHLDCAISWLKWMVFVAATSLGVMVVLSAVMAAINAMTHAP